MRTTHLLLAAALAPMHFVFAQTNPPAWKAEEPFDFSIRCSQPARLIQFGNLSGMLVAQLHLKFSDGQLTRLSYTTSPDQPHNWSSEDPVVYTDMKKGGKSKIHSERKYRKNGTETLSNIEVTLDASAAQDKLDILTSDFATHGSWSIHKRSDSITLTEKTSTFVGGKLTNSASTYWTACKIRTADGQDVFF